MLLAVVNCHTFTIVAGMTRDFAPKLVEQFVRAATEGRRTRAEAMLAARPELERDPWATLVLGWGWTGDPNEPGGPRDWAPILYVSHSVFAPVELLRELLARGADPNAVFVNEHGPMSAVYGAAGVVHDPAMTRALLEAGADPNDNESVYHSCEAESPECLRLLLEHGARVPGTNALAHALDYERPEHVRLLLEAGGDANEAAVLVHAVRRGRAPEYLRLLVEHGARLDPEAYRLAVRRGRHDQAETLAALGVPREADAADEAIGALARGERPELVPELDADAREVVVDAAMDGALEPVVDLYGTELRGNLGGTLLHAAAWHGRPDLVEELLARGADVAARAHTQYDTPLGWAVVGSAYAPLSGDPFAPTGGEHVAACELLVAAGGELEPRFLEVAEGELLVWLEERLG